MVKFRKFKVVLSFTGSGPSSILGNIQPGRERSKKKKKKSPRMSSDADSFQEGESDGSFFGSSNSPEPLTVP